jgi:hypothetical protein
MPLGLPQELAPATFAPEPRQILIEHSAKLGNIHVTLATNKHQASVGAKVPVPIHQLAVAPLMSILGQFVPRYFTDISPQAQVRLVMLAQNALLEVAFLARVGRHTVIAPVQVQKYLGGSVPIAPLFVKRVPL